MFKVFPLMIACEKDMFWRHSVSDVLHYLALVSTWHQRYSLNTFNILLYVSKAWVSYGKQEKRLEWYVKKRRGRKNVKKYTENTRWLSEEVFADGLKLPNCAIILIHCLLSIENQVMELFALHEQTKYTQIKQQESLDLLSNKFDELEREHKKKKKKKKKKK